MTEGFNSFNGSQNEMRALITEMRALNNTMSRSVNKGGDFKNTDKNTEILKSLQDTMKSINSMAGGTKSLDDSIKKFGNLIDKYNRGGTSAKEQQDILKQLEGVQDSLGDLNVNLDKGLDHLYDLSKDATKTDKERADALRIVLRGIEDQGMTLNEDVALLANKSEVSADQLKNSTNLLKIISKNSNVDTQRSFDMNRNLEEIKKSSKLELGYSASMNKSFAKFKDELADKIGKTVGKYSGFGIENLLKRGAGKLADAKNPLAVPLNMMANPIGGLVGGAIGIAATHGIGKMGGYKLAGGAIRKLGGGGVLDKASDLMKLGGEKFKGVKGLFSKTPESVVKAMPMLETPLEALEVGGAKFLGKEGGEALAKGGAKVAGKEGGTWLAKFLGKKVPGAGMAVGAGLSAYRASKGDGIGSTMEMASGIMSDVPGWGTLGSVITDLALAGTDLVGLTGKVAPKATKALKIAESSKPIGIAGMRKAGLMGAGAIGAGVVAMNMGAPASQASEVHSERVAKTRDLKETLEDVFAPILKPEKRGLFAKIGESLQGGAETANKVGNGIAHKANQAIDTAKSFIKQKLPDSVWRGDNKPIKPSDLTSFSGAGLNVANDIFKTDKPIARKDFVQSLAKVDGEMKKKYGKSFTMTGGYGGDHASAEHKIYGTAADMDFAGTKDQKAYLESRLKAHGMKGIEHDVGKGLHYHVVHKGEDPTSRPTTNVVAQNKTRVQQQTPEHQANVYAPKGTKDKTIAEMSAQIIQAQHQSSDKIASAVAASGSGGSDNSDRRLSTKSNIIFSKNNIGVMA